MVTCLVFEETTKKKTEKTKRRAIPCSANERGRDLPVKAVRGARVVSYAGAVEADEHLRSRCGAHRKDEKAPWKSIEQTVVMDDEQIGDEAPWMGLKLRRRSLFPILFHCSVSPRGDL
ncbi:hypothetical protein U1Q18_013736 [Sarracenia purpurea var. burkii]